MRSPLCLSIACCAILGAGSNATAQKDPAAGFGAIRVGPLDLETPTTNNGAVGVVELGGELFVSSRGPNLQPPHVVYVFDQQGQLLRQFSQDQSTRFSLWGYRGGTTDGTNLAFGFEDGIVIVDPSNGQLVGTFNGQPVTNPINGGLQVHRGVALDPNGDGGFGSFWVGDFEDNIYEIDFQGNILTTLPQPSGGPNWSVRGLAWDDQGTPSPGDDTLWVNSGTVSAQGELRELNPRTGQYTGAVIMREQASSVTGGIDGVSGPSGSFRLAVIDQEPDSCTIYRVDNDSLNPGETEAVLLSQVGSGPLSSESPKYYFRLPQTVGFACDVSANPALLGRPGLLIFNAGPNLPSVEVPGFEELVAQLFPGILLPYNVMTAPVSFAIPPGFSFGDEVRMQCLYFEPNIRSNNLVATNQLFWERARVVVQAKGENSFNAESSAGFFSITNLGDDAITSVTLDWTTSSVPSKLTTEFDTDQDRMNGRFDYGNSTQPACNGTYRNNSHIAAGLIFDNQNTVRGTSCDPSSNCGWIGTNPGTDPGDYQTLRFRFTNFRAGTTFEFDADTDGPSATPGGDQMEGLVVTIQLQSGATLGPAELVHVPGQNRAILTF